MLICTLSNTPRNIPDANMQTVPENYKNILQVTDQNLPQAENMKFEDHIVKVFENANLIQV